MLSYSAKSTEDENLQDDDFKSFDINKETQRNHTSKKALLAASIVIGIGLYFIAQAQMTSENSKIKEAMISHTLEQESLRVLQDAKFIFIRHGYSAKDVCEETKLEEECN